MPKTSIIKYELGFVALQIPILLLESILGVLLLLILISRLLARELQKHNVVFEWVVVALRKES